MAASASQITRPKVPSRFALGRKSWLFAGLGGEDVGEPSLRIDIVESCGPDERARESGAGQSVYVASRPWRSHLEAEPAPTKQ